MFTTKNTKVLSHKAIAHAMKHVSTTLLFGDIWDSKKGVDWTLLEQEVFM